MKLNIGCGRDYRSGWVNIDISQDTKADVYIDISTEQLHFPSSAPARLYDVVPDESVSEIYISGVLEQILTNKDLIFVMNECHRVLELGGLMTIVVPNAAYAIAHRDPMDVRKFTPATFQYFIKDTQEYKLYGSVYGFKGWSDMEIVENARHILVVSLKK